MNMNSKLNLIFILAASMFGLVLFFAGGDLIIRNLSSDRIINIAGSLPSVVQNWRMIDKIEEGEQLLKNSAPLKFIETLQKNKMELTKREIALAILDTQTGRVFEKRYWLDEAEIKEANSIRRNYEENTDNLPSFQSNEADEEYSVVTNWWNNFNSDWSIAQNGIKDDRYIVVADKFLMDNDDLVYPEEKTGEKYSDIVYIPHSKAIEDKMLVASGKDFINKNVQQAFDELAEAGIMSRAFPGKLVVDTISPAFVKNILINEQADPKLTLASTDGAIAQVERVFVRYGANEEKTFRYTVSKTGASGPAQIMPLTYSYPKNGTGVLQAYLGANLIKDVDIGRVDMVNAIKAQILVFDDHMVYVIQRASNSGTKAKKIFAGLTPNQLDEVRAMIYNGGSNKYNTATGGLDLTVKGAKETLEFIQKFRIIRDLNLFNT